MVQRECRLAAVNDEEVAFAFLGDVARSSEQQPGRCVLERRDEQSGPCESIAAHLVPDRCDQMSVLTGDTCPSSCRWSCHLLLLLLSLFRGKR